LPVKADVKSFRDKAVMISRLLIITTGGTIDKIYFDDMSDYQIGESLISQILQAMNVGFELEVNPLMRKDSLHLDENDRLSIRDAIRESDTRHVLITHGTDTMVDTAAVLKELTDRTIVLTGSLNPARFRDSDAVFNIGCAVGAVQSLSPGVYIAMNGRIWNPDKVRKNRKANRFEEI
jgi:L-asparaginase